MSDEIPRIDIDEFQRLGFLQEANRLFFHPLGLALEIVVDDDGTKRLGSVWDYRDDDEGMLFNDLTGTDAYDKAAAVFNERSRHESFRKAVLAGEVIQPIGHSFNDGESR